jgi:hypothetical protein
MATAIPNPTEIPSCVSTGYQRQNTLLYTIMTGFANVDFTDRDTNTKPRVMGKFEMNGILYSISNTQDIDRIDDAGVGTYYIYAELNTESANGGRCDIYCSPDEPEYSIPKGGYYRGYNRCLGTFSKSSDGTYPKENKKVFNGLGTLTCPPAIEIIFSSLKKPMGTESDNFSAICNSQETLDSGYYCFELTAGGGGAGGLGKRGNHKGGDGSAGGKIIEVVRINNTHDLTFVVDGNAGNGGKGGSTSIKGLIEFFTGAKYYDGYEGGEGGVGRIVAVLCKDFPYALAAFGGNGGGGGGPGTEGSDGDPAYKGGKHGDDEDDYWFGFLSKVSFYWDAKGYGEKIDKRSLKEIDTIDDYLRPEGEDEQKNEDSLIGGNNRDYAVGDGAKGGTVTPNSINGKDGGIRVYKLC